MVLGGGCKEVPPCENTGLLRVPSPDGELEAVVFERDCLAPAGWSYHVSVLPVHAPLPSGSGNTFVAGRPNDRGSSLNAPLAGWLGDSVHVFYVAPREVYKQEEEVAGRPVYYETGDGFDIRM